MLCAGIYLYLGWHKCSECCRRSRSDKQKSLKGYHPEKGNHPFGHTQYHLQVIISIKFGFHIFNSVGGIGRTKFDGYADGRMTDDGQRPGKE